MGICIDDKIKSPFILTRYCTATGKPALDIPLLNNYPLITDPAGIFQVPKLFLAIELTGSSSKPNQYHPITGRLISDVHIQQSSYGFILRTTENNYYQYFRIHLVNLFSDSRR